MYGQCEFWNELSNKCEIQKYLDALGMEPIVPIERPPKGHIDNFCKTKKAKDCWKKDAVKQMIDDAVFDEDFEPYVSIKQILWKWLKWGVIISVVGFVIFVMIILSIYFTGGGMYFFNI